MRVAERLVIAQHLVKELVVAVREWQRRILEKREGDAVGCREVLAEQVAAILEQPLEQIEPARQLSTPARKAPLVRLRLHELAAIAFGGTFQTRLNQSTNTCISARGAGSSG